jgi:hypothetical protein
VRAAAAKKTARTAHGGALTAGYIEAAARLGEIPRPGAAFLAPILGNSAMLKLIEGELPSLQLAPFSFAEDTNEASGLGPVPFPIQAPPPLLTRGDAFSPIGGPPP